MRQSSQITFRHLDLLLPVHLRQPDRHYQRQVIRGGCVRDFEIGVTEVGADEDIVDLVVRVERRIGESRLFPDLARNIDEACIEQNGYCERVGQGIEIAHEDGQRLAIPSVQDCRRLGRTDLILAFLFAEVSDDHI